MTGTVVARVAALKSMPISDLKQQWRELFDSDPPPFNRRFLESRLAYRIQELAYGDAAGPTRSPAWPRSPRKSVRATPKMRRQKGRGRSTGKQARRLIREWKGVEHQRHGAVMSTFEYHGCGPFKSLSAIARAITGTRWNGLVFFGLKSQRARRHDKPEAQSCASFVAQSTRANPARKASTWSSTRSTPSEKPARLISPAKGPRAGLTARDQYDDGGFLRWNVGAPCAANACLPISRLGWIDVHRCLQDRPSACEPKGSPRSRPICSKRQRHDA